MASQRKSSRKRQPSKKYTVDAFEGLDLDDEIDDGVSPAPLPADDDSGDDEDFHIDANASPEALEDDLSNPGELEELDENTAAVEHDYDDDESLVGLSDTGAPNFRAGRRNKTEWGKAKASRVAADPRFQPRGLLEPATRGSKEVQRLFMFGPTAEDQTPPLQGHYKWSAEPTLPSRKPNAAGFGGFKRTYFLTDEQLKREADEGWEWYELEGGKEAFQNAQISSRIDAAEGQTYMPSANTPAFNFVMGPYQEQRLFRLPVGSVVDLNEAWIPEPSSSDEPLQQDPRSVRDGWIINLGQRVQSLDWAPNHEGTRQFIALSTMPVVDTRTAEPPYEATSAPAFTPQPPHKSSIQIWEVTADAEGHVDMNHRPRLLKVLCTAWGDVKSLKWCPAPRKFPHASDSAPVNLGLLAGLWGDGAVRILDVSVTPSSDPGCEYHRIQSAAFTTQPPNTICTCFSWLSPTGITIGCANGTFGVWNIPSSLNKTSRTPSDTDPSAASHAPPVIYASLASTYILCVVSCYPSRPHIVLATTMAGHLYLIDLMDWSSNTTLSPAVTIRSTRSRIGRSILVWHDWSQMALSADDNFTLVAYPLRRLFRQLGCTRFRSPAVSVAVSPVHPFVLAGCAGGEATCNNPLRRAYESKVPIWNQIWFTHEWRAFKPGESLSDTAPDEDESMGGAGPDTDGQARGGGTVEEARSDGISRIVEGYRCEQIKLFNTEDAFTHRENGAIYTTVYELKSTVVTVGWNPNIHVGGWVAAGMASGLLRIEDIAS